MDEVLVVTVASEAARDGTALNVENRFDARFDVTYIACAVSKNWPWLVIFWLGNYTIQSSFIQWSDMVSGAGKLRLTLGAIIGLDEESIERPMVEEGIAGRGTARDAVFGLGE